MGTDRYKVQGYLESEIAERFTAWKKERGIEKDSAALNELLKDYFFKPTPGAAALDPAQIEEIVEFKIQAAGEAIRESLKSYLDESQEEWTESLDRDLRAMIESKLPTKREIDVKVDDYIEEKFKELNAFRVEFKNEVWLQLKNQFAIWNQTLQEGLTKLDSRLQATEKKLDVKDGIPTLFQEAIESVRLQKYVIQELQETTLNQLLARIEAVEATVRPIEGLAEICHPLPQDLGESPLEPEEEKFLAAGSIIVDASGNFGLVAGGNNLGICIDWLGLGALPNPASGKGVWYDWKKDGHEIASFKPVTHDSIKLLSTEEFLQFQGWQKEQLDEFWDGKWVEQENQFKWGGATINKWIVVLGSEVPDESPKSASELPDESPEPVSELPDNLTQTELAERLNCHKSQISRHGKQSDFAEWSKERDPDAIAWNYDPKSKRYLVVK